MITNFSLIHLTGPLDSVFNVILVFMSELNWILNEYMRT
jgi:hypothetical protein